MVEVDSNLATIDYFFVVANEELEVELFEQEIWKEGNLLLVKSNLPSTNQRSCSTMNADLLQRMPNNVTVSEKRLLTRAKRLRPIPV